MGKSKRAKAAARAAKRIPLVGTAVVLLPVVEAFTTDSNLMQNLGNPEAWKNFANGLRLRYDSTEFLARPYGPIAA